MEIWRSSIIYMLLSTFLIQCQVTGQHCQIGDLNNFTDYLNNCEAEANVTIIAFNVTKLERIPEDLIKRTQLVQSIDVSNTSLQFFDETLHFCQWPQLRFIEAENNNITRLEANVLSDCHLLNTLSLARCNIHEIYEEAFHGLTQLNELDLSNNQIAVISAELFKPLIHLRTLRLNNNQIGAINIDHFVHNTKLQMLDLSFNSISVIEDGSFSKLQELVTLSIESNPNLNALDIDKIGNLHDVIVNNNSLHQLHIPKNVLNVNADDNVITQLTIEPNSMLENLSIKNNNVRNLNVLSNAQKLNYLDISHNDIMDIDFSSLKGTNIQKIIVLENPIRRFNVTALTSLPKLKVIEISTSFLEKDILEQLLRQAKDRLISLEDPNREMEMHSAVTMPPVTPAVVKSNTTIRPTTPLVPAIRTSSNTATRPNFNSIDSKDILINELLRRVQNLESTLAKTINTTPVPSDSAHAYSEIENSVANLRILTICTTVAFSIYIILKITIFIRANYTNWTLPIPNIFANAPNGRLNRPRNPFNDSLDPIVEEVL